VGRCARPAISRCVSFNLIGSFGTHLAPSPPGWFERRRRGDTELIGRKGWPIAEGEIPSISLAGVTATKCASGERCDENNRSSLVSSGKTVRGKTILSGLANVTEKSLSFIDCASTCAPRRGTVFRKSPSFLSLGHDRSMSCRTQDHPSLQLGGITS